MTTPEEMRKRIIDVGEQVLGAAYVVLNTLGAGFVEKVYENALAWELRRMGLNVEQQHPVAVYYEGVVVGEFTADLVVENLVIVELKAAKALDDVHMAQCINYLKATGMKLCLLLNFGKTKLEERRVVRGL